jgi:hypothetical protein
MNKYPLIGSSICAVVLLVLALLTNVVGYQVVQSSNQKAINSEVDKKELLFQTILDIANNKEIQKVILGSEITGKRFFDPGMRFSVFNHPVLTEKVLKRLYTMGVILSKTIGKSKMHSLLEQYPVSNQGVQKGINAVIEKDATLKAEMKQLSNLSCDCENVSTTVWNFPIICSLLYPIFAIFDFLAQQIPGLNIFYFLAFFISVYGQSLHCFWY